MSKFNYALSSKPFVISAVILLFFGSGIGALWIMTVFGNFIPNEIFPIYGIHKIIQIDGFVTLILMGIGYMIIPRFRNVSIPSKRLAYSSYFLFIGFLIIKLTHELVLAESESILLISANMLKISSITIFVSTMLWTMRIAPKLLRKADYFIAISMAMLLIINLVDILGVGLTKNSLLQIQLWLLFPIFMIFGVEYKTLPSFLGFIRPRDKMGTLAIVFSVMALSFGVSFLVYYQEYSSFVFNVIMLLTVITFSASVFVFRGFDNKELVKLMNDEKMSRYYYTKRHLKISFSFLIMGIICGILSTVFQKSFVFYDLAIHYVAIGFIGISIMLYLPLMLPPIIGKTISFSNFHHYALYLIIISLVIRTIGDMMLENFSVFFPFNIIFGISGWLVVAGMLLFVIMIHRSMKSIIETKID